MVLATGQSDEAERLSMARLAGLSSNLKAVAIIAVAAVLVGAGWLLWQSFDKGPVVDSYKTCVEAGNPVQESYPETCVGKDGQRFTNPAVQVFQPPSEGMVPTP